MEITKILYGSFYNDINKQLIIVDKRAHTRANAQYVWLCRKLW